MGRSPRCPSQNTPFKQAAWRHRKLPLLLITDASPSDSGVLLTVPNKDSVLQKGKLTIPEKPQPSEERLMSRLDLYILSLSLSQRSGVLLGWFNDYLGSGSKS